MGWRETREEMVIRGVATKEREESEEEKIALFSVTLRITLAPLRFGAARWGVGREERRRTGRRASMRGGGRERKVKMRKTHFCLSFPPLKFSFILRSCSNFPFPFVLLLTLVNTGTQSRSKTIKRKIKIFFCFSSSSSFFSPFPRH